MHAPQKCLYENCMWKTTPECFLRCSSMGRSRRFYLGQNSLIMWTGHAKAGYSRGYNAHAGGLSFGTLKKRYNVPFILKNFSYY